MFSKELTSIRGLTEKLSEMYGRDKSLFPTEPDHWFYQHVTFVIFKI